MQGHQHTPQGALALLAQARSPLGPWIGLVLGPRLVLALRSKARLSQESLLLCKWGSWEPQQPSPLHCSRGSWGYAL